MGTADGTVDTTTKIVDNGADDVRWTLVFLGDGWRSADMTAYHQKVEDVVGRLKAMEPFASVWDRVNVHRIDVHSTDAGIDDPATSLCAGSGATARTYFDATMCGEGLVFRPLVRMLRGGK